MSLNPEPAPRRVGAFVVALALAVGAFVLTLGVSAYLTRYQEVAPQRVEARLPVQPRDAGAKPIALDAGVSTEGGILFTDAGAPQAPNGSSVAVDGGQSVDFARRLAAEKSALRETLGRPLASCIEEALAADPSARIRVEVTAKAESGAWTLLAFSPGVSPYFRRCAKRLELPTTLVIADARVFVVEQSGEVAAKD